MMTGKKSKSFLSIFILGVLIFMMGPQAAFSQQRQDALVLYRSKQYADAIVICEREIAANPKNIDSHVVLCWSLVGNKQYSEAELKATEALKLSSYDLRLIEILGEARYYLGKNNGAMEQFQRYAAVANDAAPRLGTVYMYMGEIYIRQGRYQHADISFTMATKKEPQIDRWWCRLGYAREQAKSYQGAMLAYDEALKLNPSSWDAKKGKERVAAKL